MQHQAQARHLAHQLQAWRQDQEHHQAQTQYPSQAQRQTHTASAGAGVPSHGGSLAKGASITAGPHTVLRLEQCTSFLFLPRAIALLGLRTCTTRCNMILFRNSHIVLRFALLDKCRNLPRFSLDPPEACATQLPVRITHTLLNQSSPSHSHEPAHRTPPTTHPHSSGARSPLPNLPPAGRPITRLYNL